MTGIEEAKAKELLDGQENDEDPKEEQEAKTEAKQEEKTPGQQLRELTSGKLILLQPFRAHSEDVTEVAFDFCGLTNEEMMAALDTVPVNNILAISNQQAMALFAATAAKCAPDVEGEKHKLYDARDIRKRMGPADAVKAIQLAKLFYNASSQAGGNNISKE